jgi:hypothetical protein
MDKVVPLRITLVKPPKGVWFCLQKGRDEQACCWMPVDGSSHPHFIVIRASSSSVLHRHPRFIVIPAQAGIQRR